MDVHLRRLRYFVAVAEELHISRAAEQLRIAQPSLSKQIGALESELGVPLFHRTTRSVGLTAAGHVLLEHARELLSAWDLTQQAVLGAHSAAASVLRVGFVASGAAELTRDILATFARRYPTWQIKMRQTSWSDPTAGLADGAVDVALLRLPIPGITDIETEVLFTQARWVALPDDHPLAAHERISFTDLLDEPFIAIPLAAGGWRDYWLATDHRNGRPVRIGAEVTNPDEWLEAIINGYGISLTAEATARFYVRPGITYRPCDGVSPVDVAVCWRDGEKRAAVHAFVDSCRIVAALASEQGHITSV